MRTVKIRNPELLDIGKMSVGAIYSGYCCPECANPGRWRRKRAKNWKKITLRTHRSGL